MSAPVKKGQELEVRISGLAFGGKGFVKIDDFMVFVERAIPEQLVRCLIVKKKSSYAEARVLEVLEESPRAVPAQCSHFGINKCGGCLWQNLPYDDQLAYKEQQVTDCVQRIGGFTDFQVQPILPAENSYFYRNKMEFSFGDRPWYPSKEDIPEVRPDSVLGLHVPGKFDRILKITDCQLMSPQSGAILNYIRDFAANSPAPAWHLHAHTGFWRHVMFREGKVSGQLMVNLVTSVLEEFYPQVRLLADELVREFPQITAIVHNVNRRDAQVAIGEEEMVIYGPDHIEEQLGDFRFTISANSFFQTNTVQALKLYELVADFAEFSGNELVYDLYCGTGTIGIFVSPHVKQVIGFELVEAAIKDARKNVALNNVENVQFFLGDMKNVLIQQTESENALPKPDVLITDPPRAGMHPKVVQQILNLAPEKIVYVSCNPATFARDVQLLCEEKYELVKARPVDLFPHTAHVETVGLLKLRAAKSE